MIKTTKNELVGAKGSIYIINDKLCGITLTDKALIEQHGADSDVSEYNFVVPLEQMFDWMVKLKIHSTGNGGIRMSTWFEGDDE